MKRTSNRFSVRHMASLILIGLLACGGNDQDQSGTDDPAEDGTVELSAFEIEHGIGPITDVVELGEFDPAMAATGEAVFIAKCSACHKTAERYVGPALGDVTGRRSAAYIMNMVLNPQEMYERHPEAQALLAEYLSYMPNQNVTPEDARAVVEYLRSDAATGGE
jgi:cytochrome c